jgi:transposase-like protein
MKSEKVQLEAGDLYTAGLSIDDVARKLNINYRTARKAINLSGVTLRDSSERLKGRTRPDKKKENA